MSATVPAGCAERTAPPPPATPAVLGPPPALISIAPGSGPATGGTLVTVTGADFTPGATVSFGGILATGVTFVDETTLTAVTPNLAPPAGPVDCAAGNPGGATAVLAAAFLPLSGGPAAGFGTNGVERYLAVNRNYASAASCLLAGGDLYVAGEDRSSGTRHWRIERRSTQTGALIPAFGVNGAVLVPSAAGGVTTATALATDGTHLFVGGVDANTTGDTWWRVEKRLLSTGALVTAFGANGTVTSNPSQGADQLRAVIVLGGSLFAAGVDTTNGDYAWRIEKRSAVTGALATGFGTNGVVQSNPSVNNDELFALVHDGTHLYAGGADGVPGAWSERWRMEKRSAVTGGLVAAFGTGGVAVSDPSAGSDRLHTMAVVNGNLYCAGTNAMYNVYNTQWQIERRSAATGALQGAFGNNGIVVSGFTPATAGWNVQRPSNPYALACDGANLYIGGASFTFMHGRATGFWRLEKRDAATGTLRTGFGTGGAAHSLGLWREHPRLRGLAIDATHCYAVGDEASWYPAWRIEKRLR